MKSRIDDELKWFMEQLSTLLSFLQSSTQYMASLSNDGSVRLLCNNVYNILLDIFVWTCI